MGGSDNVGDEKLQTSKSCANVERDTQNLSLQWKLYNCQLHGLISNLAYFFV